MGEDEVIITIVATVAAAFLWISWYIGAQRPWDPRPGANRATLLWYTPLVALLTLVAVLRTLASHDVVGDLRYIYMYTVIGLTWVGLGVRSFSISGIVARDDVFERRNAAAEIALSGGLLGVTLCYAGGNIGDGPGYWVVIASAFVSTVLLLAAWQAVELLAFPSESITVERDAASAWRLCGFLIASGLVLGRAVAGDWEGSGALMADVAALGWPVAALALATAAMELMWRVRPGAPTPGLMAKGVLPAGALLAVAMYWVSIHGMPQ